MTNRYSMLALALVLVPCIGFAQFDTGGGTSSSGNPWDGLKLNSKTKIKLDFRNSNVDLVLQLFQKSSGVTIVKDPALVGGLTITSAGQVSLQDAFQILSTTLSLKGYDLKREGTLLVIRQRKVDTSSRNPFAGAGGFDPSALTGGGSTQNSVLKVYVVKYANASEVARVINDVFNQDSSSSNNNNPFARFGGGRFGGGQGGNPFANFGGGGNNRQGPLIKASYDDFSNSVIVNAPSRNQRDVEDLIKKIDTQTEKPQKTKVYPLQYAAASDLITTVQNLLTSNAPTGRGGQRAGQQQGGGGGFFGALLNQNRNNQTQVSADTRSNSIIVTTTDENQDIVNAVIKELDKPAQVANGTFVYPLNNARADNIATLLNGAFGSRAGTNPNSTNNLGRTSTSTSTSTTNRNTTSNRPSTLTGEASPDPSQTTAKSQDSLELALKDPNSNGGELLTSVTTQGFFQNLFGSQNSSSNSQNSNTIGRDDQGRLINVRDAVGKVTVIADPSTNSVIVVASPEIAGLVKSVLEQLDRIPSQVMIETIIVEATLDAVEKLGVDWTLTQNSAFGKKSATGTLNQDFGLTSSSSTLQGFKYTLNSGSLTAFLNAINTDSRFDVLSTPRIFTSNNQQAQINISQSVPYVLSTTTSTTGVNTYNYAFLDVGIVLTVTPRITSNGYVTMDVTQTANDLQGYTSFNAPIVNQREAQTTVSVKDGETIALGGIIRNTVTTNVSKIPLLGDLPLLGKLFQNSSKEKAKTELLVFLTPRVVRTPDDAVRLRESSVKELNPSNQASFRSKVPAPAPDSKSSKPLPEKSDKPEKGIQ